MFKLFFFCCILQANYIRLGGSPPSSRSWPTTSPRPTARRSTTPSRQLSRPRTMRPRTSTRCSCRRHPGIDRWSTATTSAPFWGRVADAVPVVLRVLAAVAVSVAVSVAATLMASRPRNWVAPVASFVPTAAMAVWRADPAPYRAVDGAAMETPVACSMANIIGGFLFYIGVIFIKTQ